MALLRSFAVFALLALGSVSAFAPKPLSTRSNTALQLSKDELSRKTATSFVAAAYLLANIMAAAPATAWDMNQDFAGSSQVLAARSGGRAGGRASSASYKAAPTPTPRTIERTTIIQAPPSIVIAPPAPVMSYGYNPMPGIGLGLGINAIGAIGEGMREMRQEQEIAQARNEVTQARIKEAELEARLRQLEMAQQK